MNEHVFILLAVTWCLLKLHSVPKEICIQRVNALSYPTAATSTMFPQIIFMSNDLPQVKTWSKHSYDADTRSKCYTNNTQQ